MQRKSPKFMDSDKLKQYCLKPNLNKYDLPSIFNDNLCTNNIFQRGVNKPTKTKKKWKKSEIMSPKKSKFQIYYWID